MWNFLFGFLFADATKGSRAFRAVLLLILVGSTVVGILYAVVVFNAVRNTPETHHVQHYSSR